MSVRRIRITQLEDGSLVSRSRPGRDREGLSPVEKAVSETFDEYAAKFRNGELSTEEIYDALYAAQAELERRQSRA